MNEERYVLAQFIRRIVDIDAKAKKERGYGETFNVNEICRIIEEIRVEAVLGEAIVIEEEVDE